MFFIGCTVSSSINAGRVIELQEINGMHFIEITLNGVKTKLLIDTGASKSLLDISQAEGYRFEYLLLKEDQYIGLGGLLDIYVIYEYSVDEFFIPFLGADLSEIRQYFNEDDIQIVGILGSDFLVRNNATINFKTNKMHLK